VFHCAGREWTSDSIQVRQTDQILAQLVGTNSCVWSRSRQPYGAN